MTELQRLMAEVAILACWGAFVVVWVVGAVYNAARAPRRGRPKDVRRFIAAIIVVAAIGGALARSLPTRDWQSLRVDALWMSIAGTAVLLASTGFALWARVVLGTMWSADAVAREHHHLHTDGPCGLTRHPIYTGMLGMLLGSLLLVGAGQAVILLPVGVVLFEIKIRAEERVMSAEFPVEYEEYRRRVPQLVPGFGLLRRRWAERH